MATLLEMRQEAGRRAGLLATGTVSSATSTSITASGLTYGSVANGSLLYISSGANAGSQRTVTNFRGDGPTIEFLPALSTAPAAGDTFEVWHPAVTSISEVNRAIGRALTEHCSYWQRLAIGLTPGGDCQSTSAFSVANGTLGSVSGSTYPVPPLGALAVNFTHATGTARMSTQAIRTVPNVEHRVFVAYAGDSSNVSLSGTYPLSSLQTSDGPLNKIIASYVPTGNTTLTLSLTYGSITVYAFQTWPLSAHHLPLPELSGSFRRPLVGRVVRLTDAVSQSPYRWQGLTRALPMIRGDNTAVYLPDGAGPDPLLWETRTNWQWSSSATDTTSPTPVCPLDYVGPIAAYLLVTQITRRALAQDAAVVISERGPAQASSAYWSALQKQLAADAQAAQQRYSADPDDLAFVRVL